MKHFGQASARCLQIRLTGGTRFLGVRSKSKKKPIAKAPNIASFPGSWSEKKDQGQEQAEHEPGDEYEAWTTRVSVAAREKASGLDLGHAGRRAFAERCALRCTRAGTGNHTAGQSLGRRRKKGSSTSGTAHPAVPATRGGLELRLAVAGTNT